MKTLIAIVLLTATANAEVTWTVNGKTVDAGQAAIAAMSASNKVQKCEDMVMKVNSKGSMGLKKKDQAGDWKQVK